VQADAALVERVLQNLVDNALRYSEPGMPVMVRVAARAGETAVTVTDRGMGVPADELPRLFERFYRSTRTRSMPGTGLGLYSSRLIVENHGGRIWAEGNAGGGSTFGFSLPLHSAVD
jgi:signal transduction histidine kinase